MASKYSSQLKEIEAFETKHNVTTLFACEVGPIMWGYAHPTDENDIRLIYISKASLLNKVDDVVQEGHITAYSINQFLSMVIDMKDELVMDMLTSPMVYKKWDQTKKLAKLAILGLKPYRFISSMFQKFQLETQEMASLLEVWQQDPDNMDYRLATTKKALKVWRNGQILVNIGYKSIGEDPSLKPGDPMYWPKVTFNKLMEDTFGFTDFDLNEENRKMLYESYDIEAYKNVVEYYTGRCTNGIQETFLNKLNPMSGGDVTEEVCDIYLEIIHNYYEECKTSQN